MKHTEGPWKPSSTGTGDAVFSDDDRPIFFVPAAFYSPNFVMGREEAKANITLGAAAPELLEALEKLVNEVGGPDKESPLTTGEEIALEQARATIAKVKGKS